MNHNRRREDNMTYKLGKAASVITALGVLLGALAIIGSTVFAKIDTVDKVRCRVNDVEKCQIRIEEKLNNIQLSIDELKTEIRKKR